MYTFTVDDLAGGFRTRYEAREIVDDLISKPLEPQDDLAILSMYEEDVWGTSPEAIAAQMNWTEAP